MLRFLPTFAAATVIVTSGIAHGLRTDRWGLAEDVQTAAARLEQVPTTFGSWYSEETPISARHLQQAGAVGSLSRRYVNRANGNSVSVMILCGRHGPISVHPPTVCFTGAGFQLESLSSRQIPGLEGSSPLGQFTMGDFSKISQGIRARMRTFWSWNAAGMWQTPNNPRLTFARHHYLYKMYVSRAVSGDDSTPEDDPCIKFMQVFVPKVHEALFSQR